MKRVPKRMTDVNLAAWVIIGGVIAVSKAFAPIHELGHVIAGADWDSWASTTWKPGEISGMGILAGYGFEFAVFFSVELFAATQMRFLEAGTRLRAFSIGYIATVAAAALISADFQVHVKHVAASNVDLMAAWIIFSWPLTALRVLDFVRTYAHTGKE